jgi:mRNA interferase HigB
MRIISLRRLREFWNKHSNARQPLSAWFAEAKKADWKQTIDIISQYGNAKIIGRNRAIFDIKGNAYRLVVSIRYARGLVFVRFVGTHAEYDKIDALAI